MKTLRNEAQTRARSTGKRHRLVDDAGTLLDLVNP